MDSIPFEDLMKLVSILLPIILLLALVWLDYQDNPKGYTYPPYQTSDSLMRNQHPSSRASEPTYVPDSSRRGQHISNERSKPISVPESGQYRDRLTDSTCTLEEAAEMAFTTEGTLLHINTGHIYWSEPYEHAEKVFIEQTSASDIHSIWIKNSPCADCSSCLIDHFSMKRTKPTIYIGKIWEGDNGNNRQGLRNLRKEGFTLQVWRTPKNRNIQMTRNYLAEL